MEKTVFGLGEFFTHRIKVYLSTPPPPYPRADFQETPLCTFCFSAGPLRSYRDPSSRIHLSRTALNSAQQLASRSPSVSSEGPPAGKMAVERLM